MSSVIANEPLTVSGYLNSSKRKKKITSFIWFCITYWLILKYYVSTIKPSSCIFQKVRKENCILTNAKCVIVFFYEVGRILRCD